ncbi:hypothetical protein ACS0Y7_33135 [Burkholderia gladioli]|uniref:hypothetical protein n=1 Tax=Burkholderia gladioli TaxID=28095 RepID=UPI003F79D452
MAIRSVKKTDRFKKDYDSLTADLKASVDAAIVDLFKDPIPPGRRFHSLGGYKNPRLFTIDVTPNKAYKISLEISGSCATLRRIASHRVIDRAP